MSASRLPYLPPESNRALVRDLDRSRIASWTDGLVAGDLARIREVFDGRGAPAINAVWSPLAHQMGPAPLQFLISHWSSLAGSQPLPHIGQIDPLGLRPALGYVILLDLIDGGCDFRYRLYGSIVARVSGFDMTGKLLSEFPASPYVTEFSIAVNRAVVRRREPIYTERKPFGALQTRLWQRVALPLADDSGTVVRLLVGTVPIASDGQVIRA